MLGGFLPSIVAGCAPAGQRGAAMGFFGTAQSIGLFIGGVAGGGLFSRFGFEGVFVFATALMLIWWAIAATGAAPKPREA